VVDYRERRVWSAQRGKRRRWEEGRTGLEVLERLDGDLRSDLVADGKVESLNGILTVTNVRTDDAKSLWSEREVSYRNRMRAKGKRRDEP
jgi:hypothetical protein